MSSAQAVELARRPGPGGAAQRSASAGMAGARGDGRGQGQVVRLGKKATGKRGKSGKKKEKWVPV
jgi:hypothetical protein